MITDNAELMLTEDALAENTPTLEDFTQEFQAKAAEFEAATKSRSEELEALAKARAVISEKTGVAIFFSYGLTQTSFLRFPRQRCHRAEVGKIRKIAKSQHSLEFAPFASRVVEKGVLRQAQVFRGSEVSKGEENITALRGAARSRTLQEGPNVRCWLR